MAVLDLYINSMRTFPKRKRVKAITKIVGEESCGIFGTGKYERLNSTITTGIFNREKVIRRGQRVYGRIFLMNFPSRKSAKRKVQVPKPQNYWSPDCMLPLIVCFRRTMEGSSPYPYDTILEKSFEPIFIMVHCYPQHRSQSWHLNHFCPKTRTFLRRLLHPISSNLLKRG